MVTKRAALRYRKKFNKYAKFGRMALGDARYVANKIRPFLPFNAEYKDNTLTETITVTDAVTFRTLLSPVRGLLKNNRIGSQVRATSLSYRYSINIHASATDTIVRVMFLVDTMCNGAVPTATDVLTAESVNGMRNTSFGARFHVFRDRTHVLSTGDRGKVFVKGYIKLPRRYGRVEFDSNAGTVADITSNNLLMLVIADEVTNDPAFTAVVRTRYLDN